MKEILSYSPLLKSGIESFIGHKRQAMSPDISWSTDFLDRLRPLATGGKLLRGSLVCFSYATFSGKPLSSGVLKAATALELTHSALLVHDDVMDQDDTRRGQPSMHHQYQALAAERGLINPVHFGEGMAVCGGDAAFFLGFELLAEAHMDPLILKSVISLFTRELSVVCAGQMQDLALEASSVIPTKQAIRDVMRAKTAAYTLALPLAMGAILAAQPQTTIQTLQALGMAAGVIFQIRDDELGIMGTTAKLGKPIGSDIKNGKKTLLYYYLLNRCGSGDRVRLRTIFGNPGATTQDIKYVQRAVRRYGILELLNQEVSNLQAEAFKQLAKLALPSPAEAELTDLINFCATRQA